MFLETNQASTVIRIRDFIEKNNSKKEINKFKCKICGGTGLRDYQKMSDESGYFWPGEYCNTCNGIGYINVNKINSEFFYCYKCKGKCFDDKMNECSFCKGTGFINWIKNVIG
jgi:RecJ-like exonuclease